MVEATFGSAIPRRFWALGVSAALLLSLFGNGVITANEAAQTVKLTIDYGDGVQKTFVSLEWKEKLTVFAALQTAAKHPRGIKVEHSGSGDTTFIKAIDDAANEGQGGRNWKYSINGAGAQVSAGVAELKAGDQILWSYVR